MTTDLRDALQRAAESPSHDVDVDHLVATALRRSRMVMAGAVLGCVVLVLAIVGVVAARDSGGSSQVHVSVAGQDDAADGSHPIGADDSGVTIDLPPPWQRLATPEDSAPRLDLFVGTTEPGTGLPVIACDPNASTTPHVTGSWLSLYEYPADKLGDDVVLPTGETASGASFTARPRSFAAPTDPGIGDQCTSPTDPALTNAFTFYAFVDQGRAFVARIVTTDQPDAPAAMAQARSVLDTLRVAPLASTTTTVPTTTVPATTTTAASTTTVPSVTIPPSDDDAAIRNTFSMWINVKPREAIDPYVEDAASIVDSWRQGIAQHTAADLDRYAIRVDSVSIVDDSHADVVYSLLYDGTPEYDHVQGAAVKVDGAWKVSRATVCGILSRGGITCPPRS